MLTTLINYYNLNQLSNFLVTLIPKLTQVQSNLELTKSNKFRDFKRNFLIFITKLSARFDFENVYAVLNNIQPGLAVSLYYSLLPSIQDVEEFTLKKLIIQQYCIIIGKFYESLGTDTCKALTLILIGALDQFYKMVNYFVKSKESPDVEDTNISSLRSTFKLKNLTTPVS